jgi:hypothetical protein
MRTVAEAIQHHNDTVDVEPMTIRDLLVVRAQRGREDADCCDALLDELDAEVLDMPLTLAERIFTW